MGDCQSQHQPHFSHESKVNPKVAFIPNVFAFVAVAYSIVKISYIATTPTALSSRTGSAALFDQHPAAMRIKQIFSFGTDLWDPSNRFQTSWILSPWLLFACRALIVSLPPVCRAFVPCSCYGYV